MAQSKNLVYDNWFNFSDEIYFKLWNITKRELKDKVKLNFRKKGREVTIKDGREIPFFELLNIIIDLFEYELITFKGETITWSYNNYPKTILNEYKDFCNDNFEQAVLSLETLADNFGY